MNNLNYCQNLNSQNYGPQFSQSGNNPVVPNCQISQEMPYDTCQISFPKKKEKTFLDKFLTAMAWIGGISLALFGTYKFIEYKNPEFLKKTFPFLQKDKIIEEKSSKERRFLQEFNNLFKDCHVKDPKKIEKREREYVENAFKNRKISEKEKLKFEEKIKMRRKIRDFNSIYDTQIPLSPYGGVAQIVYAAGKLKDKHAKNKFNEILNYKIEKLEAKLSLLEKRKSLNNDKNLEVCIKANRTNDLIKSLKEIKDGNVNSQCFYVDYKEQYIKNKIIANGLYKIQLENELGKQCSINLSKETFNNMFKDNKMISQAIPNCYLVGTMNAIINNPTRRCEFYQMFSEDEKSIIFTFKDGFNVKFPKDKEGKPKLLNNQHDSLNGSIGYQMFEEAYALHRLYDRAKNGYKKFKLDRTIENDIKIYAQKDEKLENEFSDIISKSAKYIENTSKTYTTLLDGGTIYEVANTLFDSKTTSYCLDGYHDYEKNLSYKKSRSDEEVSQILINMMNDKKSIVVGRDEFKVNNIEENYQYQGINIYNSHFSVVRYYNKKTKEVHVFESNNPQKILILPLSVFNKQYSLLYGF